MLFRSPAPDDDDVLASITGLSIEVWRRHRRVIAPLFDVRDGFWHHIKCAEVLADQHFRMEERARISKAGVEARQRKRTGRRTAGKTAGPTAGPTGGTTAGNTAGYTVSATSVDADFGPPQPAVRPQVQPAVIPAVPPAVNLEPDLTGGTTGGATGGTTASSTGGITHYTIEQDRREGANAPSPGIGLSIGSLLDPEWTLTAEQVGLAKGEGVSMIELGAWLDDWKFRCIDAGTRLPNWNAAWDREYHRRMTERAKAKPKPKVSVSKKPKAEGRPMPDNWQLSPDLIAFAHKYRQDPHFIADELRNYCANNPTKYSNHDAAFRTFVLRRAKENGQAQPHRRAPAPGGNSILDAVERLDAELARRGAAAEDQPHGGEVVLSLPEE